MSCVAAVSWIAIVFFFFLPYARSKGRISGIFWINYTRRKAFSLLITCNFFLCLKTASSKRLWVRDCSRVRVILWRFDKIFKIFHTRLEALNESLHSKILRRIYIFYRRKRHSNERTFREKRRSQKEESRIAKPTSFLFNLVFSRFPPLSLLFQLKTKRKKKEIKMISGRTSFPTFDPRSRWISSSIVDQSSSKRSRFALRRSKAREVFPIGGQEN